MTSEELLDNLELQRNQIKTRKLQQPDPCPHERLCMTNLQFAFFNFQFSIL